MTPTNSVPTKVSTNRKTYSNERSIITEICEHGSDHRAPETKELASASGVDIWLESAWIFVVPESFAVMVGASTKSKAQRQNNEPANDEDFDRRKPKLEFAEPTNTDVVDHHDSNEEDGDEDTRIDFLRLNPVLYDQGGGGKLIRSNNNVLEPVSLLQNVLDRHSSFHSPCGATYVTESKTESRVAKSSSVTREPFTERNPSCHLAC